MKKLLLPIIVFILLGVITAIFALDALVKKGIEVGGKELTGSKVTIGGVNVSPFMGKLHIRDFTLYNPQGFKSEIAFHAEEIDVDVSLLSYFSEAVNIDAITVRNPDVIYEVSFSGGNLATILYKVKTSSAFSSKKKVIIKTLAMKGGKMKYGQYVGTDKEESIAIPDWKRYDIGREEGGVTVQDAVAESLQHLIIRLTALEAGSLGKQLHGLELRLKDMFE